MSFCGKLNPELISQCFRGPASQIGYQRERDVTGELIWKELFKPKFSSFRHGGQHWGEWYRRFRRANEEVESIMRLSTKKFHAFSRFFGSPVVTVGYKANYENQVRHN